MMEDMLMHGMLVSRCREGHSWNGQELPEAGWREIMVVVAGWREMMAVVAG